KETAVPRQRLGNRPTRPEVPGPRGRGKEEGARRDRLAAVRIAPLFPLVLAIYHPRTCLARWRGYTLPPGMPSMVSPPGRGSPVHRLDSAKFAPGIAAILGAKYHSRGGGCPTLANPFRPLLRRQQKAV